MKAVQTSKFVVQLPTTELASILDKLGIEQTWKSLLATHVSLSHPHFTDSILNSEELAGAEIFAKDLLEDLSIGQKSVLYEFSLAHVDKQSRKEAGQYFTPDDVAIFLAQKSRDFPEGVWLDPCSGIGNLSHWLAKEQDDPEDFVLNRLKLVDRDPLALLIARALLAIDFEEKTTDLFHQLKPHCILADFLETESIPEHDYALLNPPYISGKEDTRFKTSKARDTYAYFLEIIMETSKGFISITPQSFTNSSKFKTLREILMKSFVNYDIYCFDNVPDSIFKGVKFGSVNTNKANSTRAGVIVARNGEGNGTRITPLMRWLTAQREQMLSTASSHLGAFVPNADLFPKVGASLAGLYQDLSGYADLSSVISRTPTEFHLTIPSTPRYFTPAVKRDINRSSFITLYFDSEEQRDKYYVYLNSSVLYWWWRVNDGGMTLSRATLLSLPVPPDLVVYDEAVKKLESSEAENLVFKMNAGKSNENVKHDLALIREINDLLYPEYAQALIDTHLNSVV